MNLELWYIQDPEHGWLRVHKSIHDSIASKVKYSRYSYEDKDYLYLEEDCDMVKFLKHCKANGHEVKVEPILCRETAFVRNLENLFIDYVEEE